MKILQFLISLLIFISSSFKISQSGVALTTVIFVGIYPDANLHSGSISIRGDNCNLNWSKGVSLKKNATDTWVTSLLCPENQTISVKLLANDTTWMMGANYVFVGKSGLTVNIFPSFNPSINSIVDTEPIKSKISGNSRKLSIYYPPSYYDNPYKKY